MDYWSAQNTFDHNQNRQIERIIEEGSFECILSNLSEPDRVVDVEVSIVKDNDICTLNIGYVIADRTPFLRIFLIIFLNFININLGRSAWCQKLLAGNSLAEEFSGCEDKNGLSRRPIERRRERRR